MANGPRLGQITPPQTQGLTQDPRIEELLRVLKRREQTLEQARQAAQQPSVIGGQLTGPIRATPSRSERGGKALRGILNALRKRQQGPKEDPTRGAARAATPEEVAAERASLQRSGRLFEESAPASAQRAAAAAVQPPQAGGGGLLSSIVQSPPMALNRLVLGAILDLLKKGGLSGEQLDKMRIP